MTFTLKNLVKFPLDMGDDAKIGRCWIVPVHGTPNSCARISLYVSEPQVDENVAASALLVDEGGVFRLTGLVVHAGYPMRAGYGGAVLRAVCRLADLHAIAMYLQVDRMPREQRGEDGFFHKIPSPTNAQLRRWYERHGFMSHTMLRKPQPLKEKSDG